MTQQYYPTLNDHVFKGPQFHPVIDRKLVNNHLCLGYQQNKIYNTKEYNTTKLINDINKLRIQKKTGTITDIELKDIEKKSIVTEHFGTSDNGFVTILLLSIVVCYLATS